MTDRGVDEDLLGLERRQALRDALDELCPRDRDLLLLLVADPPVAYEEISRRLGMPIGSIGPTRARSLRRLRETAAVRQFLAGDLPAGSERGGRHALVRTG